MDTPTKYLAQSCFSFGSAFQIPMASGVLKQLLHELKPYEFDMTSCLLLSLTGIYLIVLGYIIVKEGIVL